MSVRILSFLIPLFISLYGLFMPPVQYVSESLDPPASYTLQNKLGPLPLLIDRKKNPDPNARAILSNYRLFFLLWLVVTLTMLLYPVNLWLRESIWNTMGILAILGIMLIFPQPYGETLGDRSLLLAKFFTVPLGINLALALAVMLWMRWSDMRLLDAFFTGFFPWVMIFYPFFVGGISLFGHHFDYNRIPDFKWLLVQIVYFWIVWIGFMYSRIEEYELPILFKREFDDYD